jgi:hypothetical protein
MSFWVFFKAPSGVTVSRSLTEAQKAQATFSIANLFYDSGSINRSNITESLKPQATLSLNSFNYVANTNAQTITEATKAQAALSLSSFNYA